MSFNEHCPISKINPGKKEWTIRVRAQALWKGITRETKEFRGINLILVDDSGFRIHAFVSVRFCPLFEKDLEEGQIYTISDFIVQEYSGVEFHHCLRFNKHIYFAEYTKLEKSTNEGLQIPVHSFDFFRLTDLANMQGNKQFLCDVVGIIKDKDPILEYQNDNNELKKQVKFSITDGSCIVNFTFFDTFATAFEECYRKQTCETNIIIISSAKIGSFQGELNLTNYPATRFYLNSDDNVVKELRLRSSKPSFYKVLPAVENPNYSVMTIKQIKSLTKEYIQKKVICEVTVKKVKEDLNWYDNICNKCNEVLNAEDGRFQCGVCKRYYTWPQRRFRVCLLCSDDTGGIPIILGDREVRRLTGKTVFDVDLDLAGDNEEKKFPKIITNFKDMQLKITLKIREDNVTTESDIYDACDVKTEDTQFIGTNIIPEENSMEAEDDTTVSVGTIQVIHEIDIEAPATQSNSGKRRMRKTTEKNQSSVDNVHKVKNLKIFKNNQKLHLKTSNIQKITTPCKSNKKKFVNKIPDPSSSSDDENLSLTNFQKKKKNQGKGKLE